MKTQCKRVLVRMPGRGRSGDIIQRQNKAGLERQSAGERPEDPRFLAWDVGSVCSDRAGEEKRAYKKR